LEGSVSGGCKSATDNNLVFYVSDTGIGIPFEKKQVIFDRFIQLNELTDKNISGTGLGLAIVKGFVELLGGRIWFESEHGKGSTFFFSLPLKIVGL
jgi:signal transduction histidine kinase